MTYPYLGKNYIGDKPYVVMFESPGRGMVLVNETDGERIKFGKIYEDLDEDSFEFLPPEEFVTLNN